MKQVTNIYLEEKDGHTDLVLVGENEKIVLACYEDRPLLMQRFKVAEEITAIANRRAAKMLGDP